MSLHIIYILIESPLFLYNQGILLFFPGWYTHWVQNKEAVGYIIVSMGGEPIVRENGIWQIWRLLLVSDHFHTMFDDFIAEFVKFFLRLL